MSVDENGMDAGVSLIQEMSDTPAATAFQGKETLSSQYLTV